MSTRHIATVAVAAVLGLPAAAPAATFFASDEGTGDCLTVATPCTIVTALGKVDDDPAVADTLRLAAGDYDGQSEDRVDVDGAGFTGLVIEGAGRDATILDQATNVSLSTVPFQFGGSSTDQTVRGLTMRAAASSSAGRTVALTTGRLTLEDVDVVGATVPISHSAVQASGATPELTLTRARILHAPSTVNDASGGRAVFATGSGGADDARLTIEDSEIDVAAGPSRAQGIMAGGSVDAVVRRTAIRLRRTSGAIADQGDAILFNGAPAAATPTLTVLDSAIAGGEIGIAIRPHPNQQEYRAAFTVERTSIDAGEIGVSDAGGPVRSVEAVANVSGQSLPVAVRDVVAADSVQIQGGAQSTVTLTCDGLFLGDQATSAIQPTSGACTNVRTGALSTTLPDLTEATAWNTGTTVAAALATAFRPAAGSVLLDGGSGVGAPATDLAGDPRAVDADDADCVAQIDLGAYERQGLATPEVECEVDPTASFTLAPSPAVAGQSVTATSTSTDVDGTVVRHEWDLDGDGSYETDTQTVATAQRAYPDAGDVVVGLRVTDDDGRTATTTRTLTVGPAPPPGGGDPIPGGGDPTPTPTPTAPDPGPATGSGAGPGTTPGTGVLAPPVLSAVTLAPRSPRRGAVRRAALTFALDRAATVTVVLRRERSGRRVGQRCVAPSRRHRARRACTRLTAVGRRVVVPGVAGRNRVVLGRLLRTRTLPQGRYRLVLTTPGARTVTLRFTVRR